MRQSISLKQIGGRHNLRRSVGPTLVRRAIKGRVTAFWASRTGKENQAEAFSGQIPRTCAAAP
jgi:hypothetical protein